MLQRAEHVEEDYIQIQQHRIVFAGQHFDILHQCGSGLVNADICIFIHLNYVVILDGQDIPPFWHARLSNPASISAFRKRAGFTE
jgi:hypothetical protein